MIKLQVYVQNPTIGDLKLWKFVYKNHIVGFPNGQYW